MFGETTNWENNKNHISQSPKAPHLTVEDTGIALGNQLMRLQTKGENGELH